MKPSEVQDPPLAEGDRPSRISVDPLLQRWLQGPARSRPPSSWPRQKAAEPPREPLGDEMADGWFR